MTRRAKTADRLALVKDACLDEQVRFNSAVAARRLAGIPTILTTSGCGAFEIESVSADFDLVAYPVGEFGRWILRTTVMIANDGRWASLLAQVGEPRHRLFAK